MKNPLEVSAIQLRSGKAIVLADDSSQAIAHFLVASADHISPVALNEMIRSGRGHLYAPISETRARELNLSPMIERKSGDFLRLTVSVEARSGVSTGISASDRATTLRTLAKAAEGKRELVSPGHIFPVVAREGGVLVRHHWVEASVDLMHEADLPAVACAVECLNEEGEALLPDAAQSLAQSLNVPYLLASEVVRSRMNAESIVEEVAVTSLPIRDVGDFKAHCFKSKIDGAEHLALEFGDVKKSSAEPVLVRVQSEDPLTDLLVEPGRQPFTGALKAIKDQGCGLFIYVRHPRQGLLTAAVRNFDLQSADRPASIPTAANIREYGTGSQILRAFGVERIRLLTNSPKDRSTLTPFQLEIVEEVPFEV